MRYVTALLLLVFLFDLVGLIVQDVRHNCIRNTQTHAEWTLPGQGIEALLDHCRNRKRAELGLCTR